MLNIALESSKGVTRLKIAGIIVIAVAFVVLFVAAAGAAGLTPYYGFNNLSATYPTGQCAQDLSWVAIACNGFDYWDCSTVSKVNGDSIRVGFRNDTGFWYVTLDSSFNGTLTHVNRSGGIGAPPYIRDYCKYLSGTQSYVRCYGEKIIPPSTTCNGS